MSHKISWSLLICAVALPDSVMAADPNQLDDEERRQGFKLLFNGRDLDGWKSTRDDYFSVRNGAIVSDGIKRRAMLYYVGDDKGDPGFSDFELRLQVRVSRGANSGIYFRTKPMENQTGFPDEYGYEAQIAISHRNPNKVGSLMATTNPRWSVKAPTAAVRETEWFDYSIIADGRTIELKVNDKTTARQTEDAELLRRRKYGGYIGLQGHEPGVVEFRSIRIRQLN